MSRLLASGFISSLVVSILTLAPVISIASPSSFKCEATFAGAPASELDRLLIESSHLFPQPEKYLMKSQTPTEKTVKVRIGRFGPSPETFEESLDLTQVELVGLQTRETSWSEEGRSLELHIREPATRNDIWAVPLASETDALAFLLAQKFKLHARVSDDYKASGFVLSAGVSVSTTEIRPSEIDLGSRYRLVGVSTAREGLNRDSILILVVQDNASRSIFEIRASNQRAKKAALALLLREQATLSLQGLQFKLK